MSLALPDAPQPWRDVNLTPEQRADDLIGRLTLEEKVAQLYGIWVGADDTANEVAPHEHDMSDAPVDWPEAIKSGLGQLTRPFGTAPVDPALGARALARLQQDVMAASRLGIPAVAHDECLAGFTTWAATIYPVPLAWGATFDPALVEEMARRIGQSMRSVGVHQGLAPVLDVTRDYRWGRVEETIGEDPYLIGVVGTAYVRGLESAGIVATIKHFAGYSGSKSGRNHAPVSAGPREMADVFLVPFEMAIRDGRARSVMHSYAEVDGVPPAGNPALLTTLLRETWGFEGTVVADYFGISFLEQPHGVAGNKAMAASLALASGVDVELPTVRCFGEPLLSALRDGLVEEKYVDRAVRRVLVQKAQLGLLDAGWSPVPPALTSLSGSLEDVDRGAVSLDTDTDRALALEVAEKSVVLLRNNSALPLAPNARIAVIGPRADDPLAMMGCYSFPSHVLIHHPEVPLGQSVPTLVEALRSELPSAGITLTEGCEVSTPDTTGIAAAVRAALDSDVVVVALGDRAALFGRGTSGEGCDALDLELPGVQGELLDALLDTGKPVVLVLITGRPYALGRYADRTAAIVQAFFPGEEGGPALAGILSGRVPPTGRLPVSIPRDPGGQPSTYLAPALGHRSDVSSTDPTPLYPFGFGLSSTTFDWDQPSVDGLVPDEAGRYAIPTDGSLTVSVNVRNTGDTAGAEVVQVYLHDPVAQVTRPVVRLIGFARLELAAGQQRRVSMTISADLSAFTGVDGKRVVEPGDLELRIGTSSGHIREVVKVQLTGPIREVDGTRALTSVVALEP